MTMNMAPNPHDSLVQPSSQDDIDIDEEQTMAPRYEIPDRIVSAIEVPANIQNADRAIKALGRASNLSHVHRPPLALSIGSQLIHALGSRPNSVFNPFIFKPG